MKQAQGLQLVSVFRQLVGDLALQSAKACHIELYEVGTLAVDRWDVTFGTARRGLGGTVAHPGHSLQ